MVRSSQSAAARIPAAYGERSRAVKRSSIVSPVASNPTRCIPGDSPALSETTSRSSALPVADGGQRSGERGRPPCPMADHAWSAGATRPRTGRTPRAGRTARPPPRPAARTGDPEAEVGGSDRGRPVLSTSASTRAVRAPAGRRDARPADTAVEHGRDVGDDGVAAEASTITLGAGERGRVVPRPPVGSRRADSVTGSPGAAAPSPPRGRARRRRGSAWSSSCRCPFRRRGRRRRLGHEKTAVTVVVPRPLEPPFPGGPGSSCGRAVRAPGPVPPGRAARASSWTRPRRFGGSCRDCCA